MDVLGEYIVQFGVFRRQTFRWMLENALGYVGWLVYSMRGETTTTAAISQNKGAFKKYVESFPEGREVVALKKKESEEKQKKISQEPSKPKQVSTLASRVLSGHTSKNVIAARVAKQGATTFKTTVPSVRSKRPPRPSATPDIVPDLPDVDDDELCKMVESVEKRIGKL